MSSKCSTQPIKGWRQALFMRDITYMLSTKGSIKEALRTIPCRKRRICFLGMFKVNTVSSAATKRSCLRPSTQLSSRTIMGSFSESPMTSALMCRWWKWLVGGSILLGASLTSITEWMETMTNTGTSKDRWMSTRGFVRCQNLNASKNTKKFPCTTRKVCPFDND